MSIWASIPGEDPPNYEDGYGGDETVEHALLDVAVSVVADRIRIVCEPDSTAILDPAGLAELHRRIVLARDKIERGQR